MKNDSLKFRPDMRQPKRNLEIDLDRNLEIDLDRNLEIDLD